MLAFFGNFRQEGPFSKSKDFQYLIFSDQLLGLSHFQQNSAKLINSASVSSKFQQISPISLSLPLDLVEARRFEENRLQKSNHCSICGFSFRIGHFAANILCITERRKCNIELITTGQWSTLSIRCSWQITQPGNVSVKDLNLLIQQWGKKHEQIA